MQLRAASFFSLEPDSNDAGQAAAEGLLRQFGNERPKAVLVYCTTNHEQAPLLAALKAGLGDVTVVGCSSQGVVGNAELTEEGLAMAAMAFGGSAVQCAAALQRDIEVDSESKGQSLARSLKEKLGKEPQAVIVLYDPLCGADVEALLAGMRRELKCPIVGGGAGQPWGPPIETFQYWGEEVLSHAVVALALAGPFGVDVGICHGTSPTGVSMTVTKAAGHQILEIDGKPAMDVWRDSTGCSADETVHQEHLAAWAIGIQRSTAGAHGAEGESVATVIRGAFGFDESTRGIILQAAIPEGARVMFHHRTDEHVLGGTACMANELAVQLAGRSPWAVLGFECAARTFPFLGPAQTLQEHEALRAVVAPQAPWLGMMAWGEVGPCGGEPAFHNYTYPLVVFTRDAA